MVAVESKQFDIAITGSLAQIHKNLIDTAIREHEKVMNTDPKPVNYTRWVDGHEGAPEHTVSARGVITYEYNRYDLVAKAILDTLRQRSPVKSGDYVRGHTLFINGIEVQTLADWKQGDEISISNYVPYSRKIEIGKMKMSVPGHVYETTAQLMRREYRDIADISFTYRGIINGGQVNQLTASKTVVERTIVRGSKGRFAKGTSTRTVSGGEHNKSKVRYPTITINPAGSFARRAGLN